MLSPAACTAQLPFWEAENLRSRPRSHRPFLLCPPPLPEQSRLERQAANWQAKAPPPRPPPSSPPPPPPLPARSGREGRPTNGEAEPRHRLPSTDRFSACPGL